MADDSYVLDTSALFCLKDNETNAHKVAKILRGQGKKGRVYVSFASLMEYFYVVYQRVDREEALKSYLQLKMLPIQVVESNEPLRLLAGEIKANHSLSFADAWVAATAEQLNAVLVHKDPEFEGLDCGQVRLPYKEIGPGFTRK